MEHQNGTDGSHHHVNNASHMSANMSGHGMETKQWLVRENNAVDMLPKHTTPQRFQSVHIRRHMRTQTHTTYAMHRV